MVTFGRCADFNRIYAEEVRFSIEHGFELMQVWYDRNGIALNRNTGPREKILMDAGFPFIIHALLDINEFDEHVPKLAELLNYFENNELIIHPICRSEEITCDTIKKLAQKVNNALKVLSEAGITLFLENNSRLDPIFTTAEEIKYMFENTMGLEFLIDLAHIYDYRHLKNMVSVKFPRILHVADRHLEAIHEHLPLGEGNINFEHIFKDILEGFGGRVILEILDYHGVLTSRDKLLQILHKS